MNSVGREIGLKGQTDLFNFYASIRYQASRKDSKVKRGFLGSDELKGMRTIPSSAAANLGASKIVASFIELDLQANVALSNHQMEVHFTFRFRHHYFRSQPTS